MAFPVAARSARRGVVAVEDLSAVGELDAGLVQAPPEAMQLVSAGGAAAFDELQVDVDFAERGRAVQTGRVFAQRDLDQDRLDLANDLLDRRRGPLRCFRIGQRDLGRGSPVLDRSDQLEYRRLAPHATYFERHGASRR